MQIVEDEALVIERSLGRVQILGLIPGAQRTATKSNHLAGFVMNRKHEAAAKAIVGSSSFLTLHDQPGVFELIGREAPFQLSIKLLAGCVREAETELLHLSR